MNQPSTTSSQRTQLGHRLRTRTAPAWLPWLIGVLAVILGAAASALIGFGRWSDVIGRRKMLIGAVIVFSVLTFAAAFAPTVL